MNSEICQFSFKKSSIFCRVGLCKTFWKKSWILQVIKPQQTTRFLCQPRYIEVCLSVYPFIRLCVTAVDCGETGAAAGILITPPESLFLQFSTGLMALLSNAVFITKYAGKGTHPGKNAFRRTVSIAAPELIEIAKKL
jgi:hypothetical protein